MPNHHKFTTGRPRPLRKKNTRTREDMTMNCESETELIGDYVAGNLTSDQYRAFESHRSGCRDCAAFLATYKRTIDLTKSFLRSESLQVAPVEFKLRFQVNPAS